jgi:hypothetical protein
MLARFYDMAYRRPVLATAVCGGILTAIAIAVDLHFRVHAF